MNDEEPPRPSGLPTSSKVPLFDTKDIYGNEINLKKFLEVYKCDLIIFI